MRQPLSANFDAVDSGVPLWETLTRVCIPPRVRSRGAHELRAARTFLAHWCALAVWPPIYAWLFSQWLALPAASVVCLGACLAMLALPLVLRLTGSVRLTAHLMMFVLVTTLGGIASVTGTYTAPILVWMPLVPLLAISLTDVRGSLIWSVVIVAEILGFLYVDRATILNAVLLDAADHFLLLAASLVSATWAALVLALINRLEIFWAKRLLYERERELAAAAQEAQSTADMLVDRNAQLQQQIAEREHVEAALLLSEHKYRGLVESSQDVIWTNDVNGCITFVNAAMKEIYGVAPEEALGKHFSEFTDPVCLDGDREVFAAVRDGQPVFGYDTIHRHADGRRLFVRISCLPLLDSDGRLVGVTGATSDVTEYRESQEALKQAKESAEAATHAKSEFLANMSHEIRTPLTAILGFSEDLLVWQIDDADRLEAAQTIRRNGEYLLSIINDVLDLSKIEAGRMTLERIRYNPCQVVAEATSLVRVRSDEKNLKLDVEYDGPIPESIEIDPTRLRQILVNVLSNAIKFTEQGGVHMLVRVVGRDTANPQMEFEITDTGIGMTDAEVASLFQPFTQADASMTRRFGGTGLGLAISRRLARLLGGDIRIVHTEQNVGSRFCVSVATGDLGDVPQLQDPGAHTTVGSNARTWKDEGDEDSIPGCSVLLAEDGVDNQRLICRILERAGARVEVVDNGQAAVDAALRAVEARAPFDVILMDMQMPVLDGYGATRKLRDTGYGGVIIALTAHAMAGDREKCVEAGCTDYASKPVKRGSLLQAIRQQVAAYAQAHGLIRTAP